MSFFDFKVFFGFDILGIELQSGNRDEVPDLEGTVPEDGVTVAGRWAELVLGDGVLVLVGQEATDEGEGRVSRLPVVGRLVDGGMVRVRGVPDKGGHRLQAEMVRKALTLTKREALATKYGVYYSCLLQLEYFDAVRFTAIDPLHNLFLGTARNVSKLWVKKNLLTKKGLKVLEERINSFEVGTGIG